MGPQIKGNPLQISVYLLIASYVVGEFIFPKYPLFYLLNLYAHDENPLPTTNTDKIIKTGIYAYSRNPIYLSFVLFHFGMFLTFENIMYFLSSLGLFFWLNNIVIVEEEKFLENKFKDEFNRYCKSVKKWIFF